MKVSLVVLTSGKTEGKAIPVSLSQFLIGRDSQCHLRPASPIISNRHCAILIRGNQVFVRDFDSTNGTFVNKVQVKGEQELQPNDRLHIGPLEFGLRIEREAAVSRPTPLPSNRSRADAADVADDEAAAALLLSLQEDGPAPGTPGVDSQGVPTGSTVMDLPALPPEEGATSEQDKKPDKPDKAKPATGDTSSAANTILQKYLRRSRKP